MYSLGKDIRHADIYWKFEAPSLYWKCIMYFLMHLYEEPELSSVFLTSPLNYNGYNSFNSIFETASYSHKSSHISIYCENKYLTFKHRNLRSYRTYTHCTNFNVTQHSPKRLLSFKLEYFVALWLYAMLNIKCYV